ncbi:DUF3817 domain-containing protein [Tumebacillus sp. DT12]|uniref:DUF3817 domain-containing protein n=1 Tax=Tumebacillus lacus TaxID=2995335 RepID=A0ABT3X4R5_9BACL|nr:DUF3817 domain-containing protein [Tumebacillus lacus]MCX7571891.1 DUF3817 domain-containing protein [Tumebacillus lacus]
MMKTPIGRLRVIGFIEGISFLLLLFIAMPLKYMFDRPEMVQVVGMIHGVLFVLFILAVLHAAVVHRWKMLKVLFALIASSIPFGTFVLDARLRREQQ